MKSGNKKIGYHGVIDTSIDRNGSHFQRNIDQRQLCSTKRTKLSLARKALHTYIIGHYNPSVRIIDLVSHTTYGVCVNFIHKWRDLQFNVDSERQI